MRLIHIAIAFVTLVAVVGLNLSTRAQDAIPQPPTLSGIDLEKTGPMAKVGGALASLQTPDRATNALAAPQADRSLLPVYGDKVVIDAVASDDPATLLADLEQLGMQQASMYGAVVSGLLPIQAIDEAAQLSSLEFARPAYAQTNVGLTTSQADAAMKTDVARRDFGVDGAGVTVGVLSDSFNNLGGAAGDVASADLPAGINVLSDLPSGGSDEGRAMLQLVHDVAPGASLAYHTAFLGQANFANGILRLANQARAKVIVDDIINFDAPFFQDGIVAQAVDSVVANGVSYFSSAGNQGRNSYQSAFRPSGSASSLGQFHDFDPGSGVDTTQSITVPVGTRLTLAFQWDSPFRSVSTSGAGSPNDLDIYLLNSTGTTILLGADDANVGGDPVEILQFFNDGRFGTSQFNLAIANFSGPNPGLLKYVNFGGGTINQFNTASGPLFGHANANGAEAVGAASYRDTPVFGRDPAVLESFSSAGPTPILFNRAGNRLGNPEIRQKPEIVAPDDTNTTFFGRDTDNDGFPNFSGTSAAAPHAAALAALALSVLPDLSPSQIYSILERSALDMNTPGFDFDSGFGLIQADRAAEAAL